MGVLDRIGLIIRSNINEALNRAEDPEKVINQTLMDMRQAQYEARMEVAKAIAEGKKIERDYKEHEDEVNGWMSKAQQALKAGREDLAREALKRKKASQDLSSGLKEQYEAHMGMVDKLKTQLRALDAKIDEAERKRAVLLAREKRIAAQKKINATLDSAELTVDTSRAFEAFDRMEAKIESSEDQLAAHAELDEGRTLEEEFAVLGMDSEIEDELAALKREVLGDA